MRKTVVEEGEAPPKRGKQKNYYGQIYKYFILKLQIQIIGVDNQKFLGKKATAAAVNAIRQTSAEDDVDARESVYEKHRQEMQYQFRYLESCKANLHFQISFQNLPKQHQEHLQWLLSRQQSSC